MIAPPARTTAARAPAPAANADAPTTDAAPAPETGAPDPGAAEAALEARIAALVARASTPEDEALERQREEFDVITREQAETEREINALRDMAMEQMKHDDEILKKWIELI